MAYTKRVHLLPDCLQGLCILRDYYTNGSNCEYEQLFIQVLVANSRPGGLSDDDILLLAEDIKAHSYTNDTVADIMTAIVAECTIYYTDLATT